MHLLKCRKYYLYPIIASGGAGTMEHYAEVFTKGKADAGLAASIFHFKEITVSTIKELPERSRDSSEDLVDY